MFVSVTLTVCNVDGHQKMLVQRLWFALVIRFSANMLSQTLQNTSNFCSLVSVSAPSHFDITRSICALEVIINRWILERGKCQQRDIILCR